MPDWLQLFATYRVARVRDDEVVQGVLLPGLGAAHPAVRAVLEHWDGAVFVHEAPSGTEVTLVRRRRPRRAERWWLHGLLFLLAALTTTAAGARFQGYEPLPLGMLPVGPLGVPVPLGLEPAALGAGLAFSLPLLGILLGHELGHFLTARRHGMDVSPPYFLPAPRLNVIGTFGAFIGLRSPIINRAMLLDVGIAGPLASFVLSLPALALGLAWSEPLALARDGAPARFVVLLGGQPIYLGSSLLLEALAAFFAGAGEVLHLHPLAFAGWLGLFVTALNLFPLAQLDGGHILYALLGERQPRIAALFLVLLVVLGQLWWGWWFWAALILLLGRGRVRHPAVFDPAYPVRGLRRGLGWAAVAIFVMTFLPVPFRI